MASQEDSDSQNDLVRDDRASARLKRIVKQARQGSEDLYTDRKAGHPDRLTPEAERRENRPEQKRSKELSSRKRKTGSPVRGSIIERINGALSDIKIAWHNARKNAKRGK